MKTVNELYYEFSLLVNKNNQQKNVNVDKPNFVYLYNRESLRWLNDYINTNNSTDNVFIISELLVKDFEVNRIENKKEYSVYEIPENMFSLLPSESKSYVGNCILYNYIKKPNININLEDKFIRPSLAWERGLGELVEKGIIIYKDNFEINKTLISYYRTPRKIDMQGYRHINGEESTDIDPDVTPYLSSEIINRVVTEINREFENQYGFQTSKDREQK
jgi:hypothetical protein